jgi:hypothetical protein
MVKRGDISVKKSICLSFFYELMNILLNQKSVFNVR